ncbi:MAG: hypothetical protein MMC33_004907 [Icmadophila ericetorum]|nr:hypothetical protein [Icmadophila ericetorum]
MDTGSTGILMTASKVPGYSPSSCIYGSEYLSSSKKLYEGCWVNDNITLASIAVAEVPILAARSLCTCTNLSSQTGQCAGPKFNCKQDPPRIQCIGVGFGRDSPAQPPGLPDKNPLLNIISVNDVPVKPGTMHTGYIITATGIQLGLTSSNTTAFAMTQLTQGSYYCKDKRGWAGVSICISIDGAPCVSGRALFDTGITESYLRTNVILHNITYC